MYEHLTSNLQDFSSRIGLPLDILKTGLVILINIPFGAFYLLISSPFLRNFFSLVIGLLELFFLLEFEALYIFAATFLTFLLIKNFKESSFLVSIICSSIALTIIHLQRFLFDYSSWKIDCSVYVMFLVTKLTYYGFAVKNSKGLQFSALSYFSYCFFFPSLLVGPTFSFERFLNFINLENQYKNIRFSFVNTGKVFAQSIIMTGITVVAMPVFDYEWVIKNEGYLACPLIGKLLAINVIGFFYRAKFYSAWYLNQMTVNICGLSYSQNGKNDAVVGGSIMFQIEPNPKNKTQYWNSSVQVWLKTIVYDNLVLFTKNSQAVALFGTFLISAFWHGIYLTYYIGFFQWAVLIQLTKFFYKLSFYFPKWFRQSWVTVTLVYVFGSIALNYIGMGIVVLEWENMVAFYSDLYFCVTIAISFCLVLSLFIKTPKQPKKQKKQEDQLKSGQQKKAK